MYEKLSNKFYRLRSTLFPINNTMHHYLHHLIITYSQGLRIKRIWSRSIDYLRHIEELKGNLFERDFDGEALNTTNKREQLLETCMQENGNTWCYPASGHPELLHLTHILYNHHCVICCHGILPRPSLLPPPPNPRHFLLWTVYGTDSIWTD